MQNTVIDEIIRIKDMLPKKQRALCSYLALHYAQVGTMTVAELAENAAVGTTTVLRLVERLGYESFTAFKKDIANASIAKNTSSYNGLKDSFANTAKTESSDTLRRTVLDGIRVLENLCTPDNIEQFEKAVQLILKSESVCVLGQRSSRALALYFEYVADRFYPHVRQLSREGEFVYDRISAYVKPSDVMLLYSVWPCTRQTIQVGQLCHQLGIPIILVTNTTLNPLFKIADAVIDTNSVNRISGDTALMAVTEALMAELGRRTAPQSTQNLERTERLLTENNLIMWEN